MYKSTENDLLPRFRETLERLHSLEEAGLADCLAAANLREDLSEIHSRMEPEDALVASLLMGALDTKGDPRNPRAKLTAVPRGSAAEQNRLHPLYISPEVLDDLKNWDKPCEV